MIQNQNIGFFETYVIAHVSNRPRARERKLRETIVKRPQDAIISGNLDDFSASSKSNIHIPGKAFRQLPAKWDEEIIGVNNKLISE